MEYLCIACGAQQHGDRFRGEYQRRTLLEFLNTPILHHIINGIKSTDKLSPADSLCNVCATGLQDSCRNEFYRNARVQQQPYEMPRPPSFSTIGAQQIATPMQSCSSGVPAPMFNCSDCYKEFRAGDESSYNEHLQRTQCNNCRSSFDCSGQLIQHLFESSCGRVLNITDVKCHECCSRFNNIRHFHQHTRAQQCLHCRSALNCESDYQKHALPCQCNVCGERFRCRGRSDAHERQLVACQHCYEKLHSLEGQILHKELNQCTDCRRQFHCLTLLNQHSCARFVTPPAESATPPPWQCRHCLNFYDGVYSQESHVRRNLCLCGAKFECQHLLQCHAYAQGCHVVSKKPEKRETQSVAESYAEVTCRICNVTFRSVPALTQHNSVKPDCLRAKSVRSSCLHCPLVFSSVALKVKHAELKECELCHYQFGCPLALELHHCEKGITADASIENLESKKRSSVDAGDVLKTEVADEVSSEPCEAKHPVEKKRKLTLVEAMLNNMKSEMCTNADDEDDGEEQDVCASDSGEYLGDMVKVELHVEEKEVPLEEYPVLVADVVNEVHMNIDELSPQMNDDVQN